MLFLFVVVIIIYILQLVYKLELEGSLSKENLDLDKEYEEFLNYCESFNDDRYTYIVSLKKIYNRDIIEI